MAVFTWQNKATTLGTTKFMEKFLEQPLPIGIDAIIKLGTPVNDRATGAKKFDTFNIRRGLLPGGTMRHQPETEQVQENDTEEDFTHGTVWEYANSYDFTQKADDLAEFEVEDWIAQKAAENINHSKAQIYLHAILTDTNCFYTPTSAASGTFDCDGTVSTAVGASFNEFHHREIVDQLCQWQTPLTNGRLLAFGRFGAFRHLYETFRALGMYTDKSIITGRDVPIVYNTEFHEINLTTPMDIGANGVTDTTPVAGRTAYTANTEQNWFGNYVLNAINFNEVLYVSAQDLLYINMPHVPKVWYNESPDGGRHKWYGWNMLLGAKSPYDETFNGAATPYVTPPAQRGRVRSLLVTGTSAMVY